MVEYWILTTLDNNLAGGGALQGGVFDQNALTYTYIKNGLYVHIYPSENSERDVYVPIEPHLNVKLDHLLPEIERRL